MWSRHARSDSTASSGRRPLRWGGRRTTVTLALVAVGSAGVGLAVANAATASDTGTVVNADIAGAAGNGYIVVLRKDQKVSQDQAMKLASRYRGDVTRVYGWALRGFAVNLTAKQAARLAADPAVDYVERDQTVRISQTQGSPPSWGLDRIDQNTLPLDNAYTYPTSRGVNVYVVDTGIRTTYADFQGRARDGYDVLENDVVAQDDNGHGTQVASIIAGAVLGVAKDVTVHGVRVLNRDGTGTLSGVIAGLDWVTANTARPAVVNLSLGAEASPALDSAVRRGISNGMTFVVAAGNAGRDAKRTSPARVTEALTVAATDSGDTRPSWSNTGSCVDLFAPGVGVTAAAVNSDTGQTSVDGTSFAAPHVTGAVALFLASNPGAYAATVASALVGTATRDVVKDPGKGSPNRLLYTGALIR